MSSLFAATGRFSVRRRWFVLAVWLVLALASVRLLPSLAQAVNNNNTQFLPASAPSNVASRLASPFYGASNNDDAFVVAATRDHQPLDTADLRAIGRLAARAARLPHARAARITEISGDKQAAQVEVRASLSQTTNTPDVHFVHALRALFTQVGAPRNLELHTAGDLAITADQAHQASGIGSRTEYLSIALIVVLLLGVFRSPLATLATLLPAVVVLLAAEPVVAEVARLGIGISSITQLLLIVLVLGAGTDYGLFLVFRVREEMEAGRSAHQAVEVAVARVGESITGSASTVILALLSLSLADFGLYKDLGPPLAVGIAVMLLAGLTLLPALLAIFGRATFWPFRLRQREQQAGTWGRIAARLIQRPALSLAVGILVFGALAIAVIGYKPGGFGGNLSAPPGTNAALGNAALRQHFPEASQNPTNLIMTLPQSAWTDPARLERATSLIKASGQFTKVSGPLDPNGTVLTPSQLVALHDQLGTALDLPTAEPPGTTVPATLYNAYRATARFISAGGATVQWEVGLEAGAPSTTAAINAVPTIRTTFTGIAKQVGATASGVAGEAPALNDVSTISDRDLKRIVPIAVVVIGIILALVLRSLVAPLYLLASVVVSYLASLGLAVLVFVYLAHQGGLTFILPFLMFVFLLALGEDYNILVMSRIREEAKRLPLRQAVVRAVGATGSTVTSAGLVLAGTFAVFAIVSARQPGGSSVESVGFGLAVGVLLDTFVVRTVLVPATVSLFGRLNWWPSAMGRSRPEDPTATGPDRLVARSGPAVRR